MATATAPSQEIYRLPLDGSKPEQLSEQGFHAALSRDGRHMAYVEDDTNSPRRKLKVSPLWRVDLQTLEKTMVVKGDANDPSWSPDEEQARVLRRRTRRDTGCLDRLLIWPESRLV